MNILCRVQLFPYGIYGILCCLAVLYFLLYLFNAINNSRMIPVSHYLTNGHKSGIGKLLTQIHGNLSWEHDIGGTLLSDDIGIGYSKMLSHGLNNDFRCNFSSGIGRNHILQRILGHIQADLLVLQIGHGDQLVEDQGQLRLVFAPDAHSITQFSFPVNIFSRL